MKTTMPVAVCVLCLAGTPSFAQQAPAPVQAAVLSLDDALAQTYKSSPDLEAARAELRSVDEEYAQAKSGYRPTVEGTASYGLYHQDGNVSTSSDDPKDLALVAAQPLYRGGSTAANVKTADSRIKAQRALLKSSEQQVLLNAVTAYMDVLRDQEIVRLNGNNEKVLGNHLDESQKRFDLGDITKTDVSQAQSRVAAANASRVLAEGNYHASRAAFERATGLPADNLQKPDTSALLIPASLDEAIAIAEKNNPNMDFSRNAADAAASTTRSILGEKYPRLDLNGTLGQTYDPAQRLDDHVTSSFIGIAATIPLYTGGGTDSRVRQSRQVEEQRRRELDRTSRTVRESVVDAWTDLAAANAEMGARKSQIDAAQLALDGVKVETDYGSRTTLDLLDAEQEYLNAEVSFVTAERDRIVAIYSLLSAIGSLTAENLHLNVAAYDPKAHFQKVKDKWIGTDTPK